MHLPRQAGPLCSAWYEVKSKWYDNADSLGYILNAFMKWRTHECPFLEYSNTLLNTDYIGMMSVKVTVDWYYPENALQHLNELLGLNNLTSNLTAASQF